MIIKKPEEVPFETLTGYNGVKKQIYLGPADGSNEIVMRYFSVAPGGSTPYHQHAFPHLVKIEQGRGLAIDSQGKEHALERGQLVYVADNEIHGFRNTGNEPFEFICIVPRRGEK
jgi:quercetin dioxygenase-like cupin family protein